MSLIYFVFFVAFVLLCFVLCLLLLFLVCLSLFFFWVMTFCKVSHKNFTQFHARISVVGNVSPGDQCLEAITSPQNYERLHKTCIHKVQFVHFLIAYLGLVIRFVNLPINAVDRKPQFVAG